MVIGMADRRGPSAERGMWPGPETGARGGGPSRGNSGGLARILQGKRPGASPLGVTGNLFRWWPTMQSPLVVDALRDQLLQVLDWYHHGVRRFQWGTVIHRRNERGKLRFGAITPQGESLLLSEPLLDELGAGTLLAGWRRPGPAREPPHLRSASLAGRAGAPQSGAAGRGAGRVLRSRYLAPKR